jgi:dihydroxyacetone kinase
MGAGFQLDQRIRLFGTKADDAARTAILEAAADQAHAVGQQRRGQGVAGEGLVLHIVEDEAQRLLAIDALAGAMNAIAAHACSSRYSALPSASVQEPAIS